MSEIGKSEANLRKHWSFSLSPARMSPRIRFQWQMANRNAPLDSTNDTKYYNFSLVGILYWRYWEVMKERNSTRGRDEQAQKNQQNRKSSCLRFQKALFTTCSWQSDWITSAVIKIFFGSFFFTQLINCNLQKYSVIIFILFLFRFDQLYC